MKQLVIAGLALLCGALHVPAQVVTLLDQENLKPLSLVTLSSGTPSFSIITDGKGQADVSGLADADRIEIRRVGYETQIMSYQDMVHSGMTIYLMPSNLSLDELVVSATRWEQSRRDVPGKVISISAKQIGINNPQTAADLLGQTGEIFIQKSQQGGGSPMIRGFATNRLLIAVDGVRMNNAIFRSGNLQNVISIDPLSIETAEVSFGPGSVVYGSDAIAGVMSFYTLSPQLSDNSEPYITGSALLRYASASEENTVHVDVNVGWKKWGLLTSLSHNDFGDLRMGRHGPDEYLRNWFVQRIDGTDRVITNNDPLVQTPGHYQQTNLMQKVLWQPSDNWLLEYGLHYATTTDYARYDRLLRTRNGLPRSAEWNYGPQVWNMHVLKVAHVGKTTLYDSVILRLSAQQFQESRIDRDFNDDQRRTREEEVNAYALNIDFSKSYNKHRLLYGMEGVLNKVESTGIDTDISTGVSTAGPARYPQADWLSYAAYATWQYRLHEQVNLQAGARYNGFALDATFDTSFYPFPFTTANLQDDALTGSLGMVYQPTNDWHVGINAATGFRSPNVDDIGKVFDSEPGAVVVPNPNLSAEYAYNIEADIAKIFGDRLKLDIVAFYTLLDNALVRRDFTLNGADSIVYAGELSRVQAIQNAAQARVYGVQAGLELKIHRGWSLSSQFNYQQGEEELEDGSVSPLRHAAPWFGQTRLVYSAKRLRMEAHAQYSGAVTFAQMPEEEKSKDFMYAIDDNGNPWSPAWLVFHCRLQYQLEELLMISAGVENITDRRYRPYSSGMVAPGRNIMLSVKATF